MASPISISQDGLKISRKSGQTKRSATVGPSGGSIGISLGPVEVKINSDGSIGGKISAGPISIEGNSDGNIGIGIQTPLGGIDYNSDGSGSITSPFGIGKMEVERKGCVYIKRTYLAGTLIDTEYQQIPDCKEEPPDPPDPDDPKHPPAPINIDDLPPTSTDETPLSVPDMGYGYYSFGNTGTGIEIVYGIWGAKYIKVQRTSSWTMGTTYFEKGILHCSLNYSKTVINNTYPDQSDSISISEPSFVHPNNRYMVSFSYQRDNWIVSFANLESCQWYCMLGTGEQAQEFASWVAMAAPASKIINVTTTDGINEYLRFSSDSMKFLNFLPAEETDTPPPPPGPPPPPIEKPPPPPPIMSNCCKESKVDLARVEEALERLEQVIGTREILNDPQGYAVPNKMLIPGGEGYSFSKNYLNIFTWLFAAVDRYGFDGPIVVDIADVDKGKAGNQSLQMQVNSLSTAIQTLLSLAVENKGDQATRLNIQIRLAFMLTRLMRMMHKMYYLVVAILEGLGIPTIKKYIKNIPFEFNLNPEDLGFDKKAEKLDTMNEDELESQLPKILDTKEMDLIVEQFKPNQLDLRGFLLKLINKK